MKKFNLVMMSFLVLTGCSKYASNAENLYLQSRNAPIVDAPPPLTNANMGHFYDLPEQKQAAEVSIVPPVE